MALRYEIGVDLPAPVAAQDLVKPMLMRPPVAVEFRAQANMDEVVREICQYTAVRLDAAVGAGKSTRVPPILAKVTGALVMHVVPNPLMAYELYHYQVKTQEQAGGPIVPLELWAKGDMKVPRNGVLYMSSADLVGLIAVRGKLDQYCDLTVFLDEAHESDAYTYLLRALATNLGMHRIVLASATFGPSGERPRETVGTVKHKKYDATETPETWKVNDVDKPWYVNNLHNGLMVFVDSRAQVKYLRHEYELAGVIVHRLESRMSVEDYANAMRDVRNKKGPLVVLLADYSFRSAGTYDLDRFIDTGYVSYYDPTPGAVRRMSRPVCHFESVQAAGRGGRVRKGVVEYYAPDIDFPKQICDLEGVEREAAAYVSRILGFKPLGVLSATVMSLEDLPVAISPTQALNSAYPLTSHIMDENGHMRSRPASACSSQMDLGGKDTPSISYQLMPDGPMQIYPGYPRDFHPIGMDENEGSYSGGEPPKYTRDEDYLEFVASLQENQSDCVDGTYLRVGGVDVHEPPTVTFPRGLGSVLAMANDPATAQVIEGISDFDRRYALSMAANRYNMLNVEISAIRATLENLAQRAPEITLAGKQLVLDVFQRRAMLMAERKTLYKALKVFSRGRYEIHAIEPLRALEQRRIAEYANLLDNHRAEVFSSIDYGGQIEAMMLEADPSDVLECDSRRGVTSVKSIDSHSSHGGKSNGGIGKTEQKFHLSIPSRFGFFPPHRVKLRYSKYDDGRNQWSYSAK